jgi:hypothetical protein
MSAASEEVLASIIGAIISGDRTDENLLLAKATVELVLHGVPPDVATSRVEGFRGLFEEFL